MPISLGPIIAERQLVLASGRFVFARLGRPRRSTAGPWECAYQVAVSRASRVRRAVGEDAMQALLLAFVGLRAQLVAARASWLSPGDPGIQAFIPSAFGLEFAAELEALVDRAVVKRASQLERRHQARVRKAKPGPANQRMQPTRGRRVPARG